MKIAIKVYWKVDKELVNEWGDFVLSQYVLVGGEKYVVTTENQ